MIRCTSCARENPPDSRFRSGCATGLTRSCPKCGRRTPPTLASRNGCGRELHEAHRLFTEIAAAGHAERRAGEPLVEGNPAGGRALRRRLRSHRPSGCARRDQMIDLLG